MPRTSTAVELSVTIDRSAPEELSHQIFAQIRHLIRNGSLKQGDRLPSIRSMANACSVSHATAERAYFQLAAEGYVSSRPRSGYVVEHIDIEFFQRAATDSRHEVERVLEQWKQSIFQSESLETDALPFDFSYMDIEPGLFPRAAWLKALTNVTYYHEGSYSRYEHETESFQSELAGYLARSRGFSCHPGQITSFPSFETAFTRVLSLVRGGGPVACEQPCLNSVPIVANRLDMPIAALPLHSDQEAFLNAIRQAKPSVVFVCPSHQYPTGSIMPLNTRIKLLELADELDFVIVEDDTCCELRYRTAPIAPLKSLDKTSRVVYFNTFSKILSPSLRVSYVVLPPAMLERYLAAFGISASETSLFSKAAIADLLASGEFERHIRKMRTAYQKKHDALVSALRRTFGNRVTISGEGSGTHLLVAVRNGMDQNQLVKSARAHGAKVYKSEQCWFSAPASSNQIMIGFTFIAPSDIAPGVQALRDAWLPR